MSVVTDATIDEKGGRLPVVSRLMADTRDWIPASAGMTDGGGA